MAPESWLKKVFVPEKERHSTVGEPEPASRMGNPGTAAGAPEPPGADQQSGEAPGAENGEPGPASGAANADPQGAMGGAMPSSGPPPVNAQEYHYHYPDFDEEKGAFLARQHTRIILAIVFVLVSAGVMWWILM